MSAVEPDLAEAVAIDFFTGTDAVFVLPTRAAPRLVFCGGSFHARWAASSFYPAFSIKAKCFRFFLRLAAAGGFCPGLTPRAGINASDLFFDRTGIHGSCMAVMIGTPGSAQKAIAQVRQGSRVAAYLKYGVSSAAKSRVRQEARVLKELPPGIAPVCLASGALGAGEAVLMESLDGAAWSAGKKFPHEFMRRLEGDKTYPFLDHPWIQMMISNAALCPEDYPRLMQRAWRVVIMHGDFAPWNLVETPGGCRAFDWESGTTEGLSFIDAAHYFIQSAYNLDQSSAGDAAKRAVRGLMELDSALPRQEAAELIRLTICWIVFRDGLDLHKSGPREVWYRDLINTLSAGV